MSKKEFFRAVNMTSRQDTGHIAGDNAISLWLMRQGIKARSFSEQQVADCYTAIKSDREVKATQPRRLVFEPGAGDGFGLWTTVEAASAS